MNSDQLALFEGAGELARRFHEAWQLRLEEPGPERPWFFHPLGYHIDYGYHGSEPEYDKPTAKVDPRTIMFARQMGALNRTTKIWQNKKVMVNNHRLVTMILTKNIAREHLPPHLDCESRQLTDEDMKDVVTPVKPDKKEGAIKELEWRQQWKTYNDQYNAIQTDHKIRLLLKWFKEDFFQWLNYPECVLCKVTHSFPPQLIIE
jgi:hypothetical protein